MEHTESTADLVVDSDIDGLFAGEVIYTIPLTQPPYRGGRELLNAITEKLQPPIDEAAGHEQALGALILFAREGRNGAATAYRVADGQQRIITLNLLLCALAGQLAKTGNAERAAEIVKRYLLADDGTASPVTPKLQPAPQDRVQYRAIIEGLVQGPDLAAALTDVTVVFPDDEGDASGLLSMQFHNIERYLELERERGGPERLKQIDSALTRGLTVRRLIIRDRERRAPRRPAA